MINTHEHPAGEYEQTVNERKWTVLKRKQVVGVTIYNHGVIDPGRKRFVDPRHLEKEFFFMRKAQKVIHIMASAHNKASYNSLIHKVKTYNNTVHGRLVSI